MQPRRKDKDKKNHFLVSAKIDVELELAAVHRMFIRSREALKTYNDTAMNPGVEKLLVVLNDMDEAYQKRVRAAMEEQREEMMRQLMEEGDSDGDTEELDFMSFLDFLNTGTHL